MDIAEIVEYLRELAQHHEARGTEAERVNGYSMERFFISYRLYEIANYLEYLGESDLDF